MTAHMWVVNDASPVAGITAARWEGEALVFICSSRDLFGAKFCSMCCLSAFGQSGYGPSKSGGAENGRD